MRFKSSMMSFFCVSFNCIFLCVGNQWSFINNNLHTQSLNRSSKGSSSLDRLYSRKIRKQLVHHKQVICMVWNILVCRVKVQNLERLVLFKESFAWLDKSIDKMIFYKRHPLLLNICSYMFSYFWNH